MKKHPSKTKRVLRWAVGGLFLVLVSFPWMAGLQAAGVVGTGAPATCTESAFNNALGGGGAVTFNCGGAATIPVTALKQISNDTTIDGGGLITLNGSNTYLFQVSAAKSMTIRNITLLNFNSLIAGAIENFGTTTLTNVTLTNNKSTNAVIGGGAVVNHGTLIVSNSLFSNNQAIPNGGAIYNDGPSVSVIGSRFLNNKAGLGGAIVNTFGTFTVQNTIFENNTGFDGGAVYVLAGATVTINGSTFSGNSANFGGAIENSGTLSVNTSTFALNKSINDGGAVWNLNGLTTLTDVMVNENQAGLGGGVSNYATLILNGGTISRNVTTGNGGGIYNTGNATLSNATLSGNQAAGTGKLGGGIYSATGNAQLTYVTIAENQASSGAGFNNSGPGTMNLQNVVLSKNLPDDCAGTYTSLGHNLSGDTSCGLFTNTDFKNTPALLGPLGNNGGLTLTHMPLPHSPAIDGGQCLGGIPLDQRGVPRPQGGSCDIGAVEKKTGDLGIFIYLPVILR
jgi:hypothetical protein